MKQISQEEFEQYIQDIIDGKMTRKRLASELETVMRTINHRIMELEGKNPALYQAFIQKFPYTPKEIKLDVEALAIKVINNGIEQTARDIGISTRSIARKIKQLETINPELLQLYEDRNGKMSDEERELFMSRVRRIEEEKGIAVLERQELVEKEESIRQSLTKFEELLATGMDKNIAARKLGYSDYAAVWKKQKELERIRQERKAASAKTTGQREVEFRKSMKVDVSKKDAQRQDSTEVKERRSGREKE